MEEKKITQGTRTITEKDGIQTETDTLTCSMPKCLGKTIRHNLRDFSYEDRIYKSYLVFIIYLFY